MSHPIEGAEICIVSVKHAWGFLGVWAVAVLGHALWRSVGSAPQDPIRPSGP